MATPEVQTMFGSIPPVVYYIGLAVALLSVLVLAGKGIYSWGKWVERVNAAKQTLDEFVVEIRRDIKDILDRLPNATTAADSPLRLTDLGKAVSDTLDARGWAERNFECLTPRVQGREPYEVYDFCSKFVNEEYELDAEQDAKISACAYENGISRKKVLDVLVVELRDKLLEEL